MSANKITGFLAFCVTALCVLRMVNNPEYCVPEGEGVSNSLKNRTEEIYNK